MNPSISRDGAQSQVADKYIAANRLKACAVLSTGFGKSKVAIDIILRLQPKKILILVNSTLLRDYNWRDEFDRWGWLDLYDEKVETATYQAAYKWKQADHDLSETFVIADEVDFAADTGELAKFFYEYPKVRILGLTGFITDNKLEWFGKHLPVFVRLSAYDAQQMGILNKIHLVFVKYDLSNNSKDYEVKYKKYGQDKVFYQSENNAYDYANKQVNILLGEATKINLEFMQGLITKGEYDKALKSYEYKMRSASAKRQDILLNGKATADVARKILNHISTTEPNSKTIVFSKRTKQSILVCGEKFVYNGEIAQKKATSNYEDFVVGTKKVLGVCDKVNRGANIPNLNIGLFETFFGSDTKATQRFGRLMRLHPKEKATAYILLPYYMRKEKNNTYTLQKTQQVVWAENMLRSTKINSSTIWDYCAIKS